MATIDDSASVVNLVFHQGDDWVKQFRFTVDDEGIDMTDWEGSAQIRRRATSDEVLADLTVTIGPNQDVAETAGYLTVELSDDDSSGLPSECVWDLELINSSGLRKTYLKGSVTVDREVTRDDE